MTTSTPENNVEQQLSGDDSWDQGPINFFAPRGRTGNPGKDGVGKDGKDGRDGRDGRDGADSTVPGRDGKDGKDGKDGTNGKDGSPGKDGAGVGTIIDKVFTGLPLITYGHSFLAEQGLTDDTQYYARRLATQYGMTYPTLNTVNDLKRAIGGSGVVDAANKAIAGAPFAPNTKAVILVQALINSARLNGARPADLNQARDALRSMLAIFSASARVEDTSNVFTFSPNHWTKLDDANYSGGNMTYTHTNTVNGQYVEFTAPNENSYIILAGKNAETGPTVEVKDVTAGTTIETFSLASRAVAPITSVPIAYRIPATARGRVIRLTKTGGTTSISLDVMVPQSTTPPPVILMKEPYLSDYSKSTMFPNGSDAVLDAFNAIIDEIAAEFPNVIVANPNTGGHWNEDTGLQGDGVHPNSVGNTALKDTVVDAARTQILKKIIRANYGL